MENKKESEKLVRVTINIPEYKKEMITKIVEKSSYNNVSELVKKGEQALSNFIDAIAILLITSCFIPIIVLIFLIWIIKMIFGINISLPNKKVIAKNHEE